MSFLKRAMEQARPAEVVAAERRIVEQPRHSAAEVQAPLTETKTKGSAPKEFREFVRGRGIYLGHYWPKDRTGKSLNKKYRVFAAPHDFSDALGQKILLTYKEAAREVSKLKRQDGGKGRFFSSDIELYQAFNDGSYNGEWFIPPRELLNGENLNGEKIQIASLYDFKNTNEFRGTFQTDFGNSDYPNCYWSSSRHRVQHADWFWYVLFSDGSSKGAFGDSPRLSCRPCRLELVL